MSERWRSRVSGFVIFARLNLPHQEDVARVAVLYAMEKTNANLLGRRCPMNRKEKPMQSNNLTLRHLALSAIAITLCSACSKVQGEGKHEHRFPVSRCKTEVVSRENLSNRLWVELEHGPSKSSGWIYTAGYPEFFITNGEDTAEIALRNFAKKKCFCGGEWWIKTNGYVRAVREISRRTWQCECGETEYLYFTNTFPVTSSKAWMKEDATRK